MVFSSKQLGTSRQICLSAIFSQSSLKKNQFFSLKHHHSACFNVCQQEQLILVRLFSWEALVVRITEQRQSSQSLLALHSVVIMTVTLMDVCMETI